MSAKYRATVSISGRDCGVYDLLRPSALLGIFQDVSTDAVAEQGLTRSHLLEDYGVVWMLVRQWVRLDRPLVRGETLTVETWHRSLRGVVMHRDLRLTVDGEPVGQAVAAWVLAEPESGRLLRFSKLVQVPDADGDYREDGVVLKKLVLPRDWSRAGCRTWGYSDGDVNGHVNNCRYADLVLDAVCPEGGVYLSQLRLDYLAQCYPGEMLELSVNRGGAGQTYVCGAGAEGKLRFGAAATLSPLDNLCWRR